MRDLRQWESEREGAIQQVFQNCFCPRSNVEFSVDVLQMRSYGFDAEKQRVGDFLVVVLLGKV